MHSQRRAIWGVLSFALISILFAAFQNCAKPFRASQTAPSIYAMPPIEGVDPETGLRVTFQVSDKKTGSKQYTNQRQITIATSSQDPVAEWCVLETPSAALPDEVACESSWTATPPTTFDLSSSDSMKILWLFYRNTNQSLMGPPARAQIFLDAVAPSVQGKFDGQLVSPGFAGLSKTLNAHVELETQDGQSGILSIECWLDGAPKTGCGPNLDFSSLSEGTHLFQAVARDRAGNSTPFQVSWINDVTAPSIQITSGPIGEVSSREASLHFASTDSGSGLDHFVCQINSEPEARCTSPLTRGALPDGAYHFQVRAIDKAGNASSPLSLRWTINTQAPALTFTQKPEPLMNSSTATFSVTVSPTGSRLRCRLLSTIMSDCSFPTQFFGLYDGTHTFEVEATSPAGVKTLLSHTWQVDTIAPTVKITSTPSALSAVTDATFAFLATDDGSGIASAICSWDGEAPVPCTSPVTRSNLAAGTHSFSVVAVDKAGNRSSPSNFSWSIDSTAPSISLNGGPTPFTQDTTASFQFSASPAGSTFRCRLDSAASAACTSPKVLTGLSEGPHLFEIEASSPAGLKTVKTVSWAVDKTGPTLLITESPANPTSSTSATFAFTAHDSGSGLTGITCSWDGAPATSCTSPVSKVGLAAGNHTLTLVATDGAGNSSTPKSYTWTIDSAAPTITFVSTTSAYTNSSTATFQFTVSPVSATLACRLDSASFVPCASPKNYSSLTSGTHTFEVEATSSTGIKSSKTHTWQVDQTQPTLTWTSTPPVNSSDSAATFVFTASDTGSGLARFECSWDGAPAEPCTSPATRTDLAQGAHAFSVAAFDLAGNSSAPATHNWTVDSAAPTITISSQPPALSATSTASFQFSVSPTTATLACRIGAVAFGPCTSPKNYTGLADGSHIFEIEATSLAGVKSRKTVTWQVDQRKPDVTLASTPPTNSSSADATFTFTGTDSESGVSHFTCSWDGAPATTCTSPATRTGMAQGSHTFSVTAWDLAGNTSAPASYSWSLDSTAPTITFVKQPPALTKETGATMEFNVSPSTAIITCRLDTSALASCASPKSYTALSDGTHVFEIEATTLAGVKATKTLTWQIDTAIPTLTISNLASPILNLTTATFTMTSSHPTGLATTYQCALNGSGFAACTSPHTLIGLVDGNQTLQVRAVSATGVLSAVAQRTWTVDTTPPTFTTFVGPTAVISSASEIQVSWTAADSGSGLKTTECRLQSAPFTPCTSPVNFASLSNGTYQGEIRLTDQAGNTALRSWTTRIEFFQTGTLSDLFAGQAFFDRIDRTDCDRYRSDVVPFDAQLLKERCRQILTHDRATNIGSSMNLSTSMVVLDGKWYLFNREYFWESNQDHQTYCPVAKDHSRIVVRVSADQGRSWGGYKVLISPPVVTGSAGTGWVTDDGIPLAQHPTACGIMDGTAYFDPHSQEWHMITQCIGPETKWRICHFKKTYSNETERRDPLAGTWVPTMRPLRLPSGATVSAPYSIDLNEISVKLKAIPGGFPSTTHLAGEGTVEIMETTKDSGGQVRFYVSLHSNYIQADGDNDAGVRVLARTTNFKDWDVQDPADPRLPGRPIMGRAECDRLSYPWKNGCRGVGHANTKKEGEYYYSVGESMDSSFGLFPPISIRKNVQLYTFNFFRSKTWYDWEAPTVEKPTAMFAPMIPRSTHMSGYTILWQDPTGTYMGIANNGFSAKWYFGIYKLKKGTEPKDYYRRDSEISLTPNEYTWANRHWVRHLYKNLLKRPDALLSDDEVHFWARFVDNFLYDSANGKSRQQIVADFVETPEFSAAALANGNSSAALVDWVARDVLGLANTPVNDLEKSFWVQALDKGATRSQVLSTMLSEGSRVVQMYLHTLGRLPGDLGEVEFRQSQLQKYTYKELFEDLADSPEGLAAMGLNGCADTGLAINTRCTSLADEGLRTAQTSNCELDFIKRTYELRLRRTVTDADACWVAKNLSGSGAARTQSRRTWRISLMESLEYKLTHKRLTDHFFFHEP